MTSIGWCLLSLISIQYINHNLPLYYTAGIIIIFASFYCFSEKNQRYNNLLCGALCVFIFASGLYNPTTITVTTLHLLFQLSLGIATTLVINILWPNSNEDFLHTALYKITLQLYTASHTSSTFALKPLLHAMPTHAINKKISFKKILAKLNDAQKLYTSQRHITRNTNAFTTIFSRELKHIETSLKRQLLQTSMMFKHKKICRQKSNVIKQLQQINSKLKSMSSGKAFKKYSEQDVNDFLNLLENIHATTNLLCAIQKTYAEKENSTIIKKTRTRLPLQSNKSSLQSAAKITIACVITATITILHHFPLTLQPLLIAAIFTSQASTITSQKKIRTRLVSALICTFIAVLYSAIIIELPYTHVLLSILFISLFISSYFGASQHPISKAYTQNGIVLILMLLSGTHFVPQNIEQSMMMIINILIGAFVAWAVVSLCWAEDPKTALMKKIINAINTSAKIYKTLTLGLRENGKLSDTDIKDLEHSIDKNHQIIRSIQNILLQSEEMSGHLKITSDLENLLKQCKRLKNIDENGINMLGLRLLSDTKDYHQQVTQHFQRIGITYKLNLLDHALYKKSVALNNQLVYKLSALHENEILKEYNIQQIKTFSQLCITFKNIIEVLTELSQHTVDLTERRTQHANHQALRASI